MDKKNTFIGILFLVAAFAMIPLMNKRREEGMRQAQEQQAAQTQETATAATAAAEEAPPAEIVEEAAAAVQEVVEPMETTVREPEELSYLKNDLIEVIFTNQGGGIKKVAMAEYEATKDSEESYLFNHYGYAPMLGISLNDGAYDESFTKSF